MLTIILGEIDIHKYIDGVDKTLAIYEKDRYFGEFTLILQTNRLASVRTRGKCWLLRLYANDFKRILDTNEILNKMFEKTTKTRLVLDLK
eukprot:Awhi_evm1s14733